MWPHARKQGGDAVARRNHRPRTVLVPGKATQTVKHVWVVGICFLGICGVGHVQHKAHHVLLTRDVKQALLGDGDGLWLGFRLGHNANNAGNLHNDESGTQCCGSGPLHARALDCKNNKGGDDHRPYKQADTSDGRELGPVHKIAVGDGQARVHEEHLCVGAHAKGHDDGENHLKGATAERREHKAAGNGQEKASHNHDLPHLADPKEQAVGAAGNKLERSHHKHREDEKDAGEKRKHDAAAPGDARRAARGGPARVAARGCKRIPRRRVGRGLAGGVDAGDRGLGHAARPLVHVQDPHEGLARAPEGHAQHRRERHRHGGQRLDRVGHDRGVHVREGGRGHRREQAGTYRRKAKDVPHKDQQAPSNAVRTLLGAASHHCRPDSPSQTHQPR